MNSSLASRTDRFLAFLIDIFVAILPLIFISPILYAYRSNIDEVSGSMLLNSYLLTIYLALFVTNVILLSRRGQTIGKNIMNISVFHDRKNEAVGFWYYTLMRHFVGETLIIGALPILNFTFYPIYALIDHLFIFRADKKALHDHIANTKVIQLPTNHHRENLLDFSPIRHQPITNNANMEDSHKVNT